MKSDFGVNELTATSLSSLRKRLEVASYEEVMAYLVAKMGYDSNITAEFEHALSVYEHK